MAESIKENIFQAGDYAASGAACFGWGANNMYIRFRQGMQIFALQGGFINNPNDPGEDHFFRTSFMPIPGLTYDVTLAWDASRNVFVVDFAGVWRGEMQTSTSVAWGPSMILGSANVDKKGWKATAGTISSIKVR